MYNNRSLFSDYYLEELVVEDSHWRALKAKASDHRERIGEVLKKAIPGINGDTPEAEVERRLIRPILDTLGHVYFVQPAVPSSEGVRIPDYAFFPSPEAQQGAESHKGELEFFKTALAVGDAKAWERSLDKRVKGPGDPFTNHNPSYQIDCYLRATERKWGLLTNGRHWRLYHRDLSYRLDVYYEVDLPQIITLDEDAFLYFLAFFHKEAFQPDGAGECFLDRAYRASTEYAAKVGEELKKNVYKALCLLAEGFLAFPGNSLKPQDLDLIRENAFIVIYRLLFILYAEAREFLPVTNPTYWGSYSLRALAHEIATKEPFEANLHPTATGYWSRLQELFRLINNGDDLFHIPPYNGRLFDDQKEHQSLAAWKIGDRYLAAAIDQLARAEAPGRTGRGFVSYRDLSIRELGSIYEGLLEHRPRYATQDVAVVKEDKRERFVPLTELGNQKALETYRAGSVYLETDKGERKATGSYYTPQYIVEYIVKNTLGPLLEEAKRSDGNLIDAILALKVLDPAMGSGHFLVEATDYLARALVEALGGDPREMEEDEIRWARREVVERCIYGVDLNPLAVDLAKLSLWLSTVSLDKPLNFLDHHLRCGNSLIGARLDDLGMLPELGKKAKAPTAGTTLAGHQFATSVAAAVNSFHRIMEAPSATIEDIHRKENAYRTARYALQRIKEIAGIWTSVYFDNDFKDKDGYERLLLLAESGVGEWPKPGEIPWADKARQLAEAKRFFHWELEFPEVFFDRNGQRLQNPGFSAVIGNPPYDVTNDDVLRTLYLDSIFGRANLYGLFIHRSAPLLSNNGRFAFINPRTCLTDKYFLNLRKFITRHFELAEVLSITDRQHTFADVLQACIILSMRRAIAPRERYTVRIREVDTPPELSYPPDAIDMPSDKVVLSSVYEGAFLVASDKRYYSLFWRSDRTAVRLSDISDGAVTGPIQWDLFKPYFVSSPQKGSSRLIWAENIQRYEFADSDLRVGKEWLALPKTLGKVPNIEDRAIITQRTTSTEQPRRIIATKVTMDGLVRPAFSENHTNYITFKRSSEYALGYILAVLNSSLNDVIFRLLNSNTQVSGGELNYLPIRRISFTTPEAERERLVEEAKRLYYDGIKKAGLA